MTRPGFIHSSVLALALAVVIAGCGGGSEIPRETALALVSSLDRVERGVREGECERTRSTLQTLEREASTLPSGVDEELRTTLGAGVRNLGRLFRAECRQKPEPLPQPEPEPEVVEEVPVDPTPEPEPIDPEPEEEPAAEPEEPKPEAPDEPQSEKPKPREPEAESPPREEEKEEDICGENPAPTC